jgi:hypothetical protein
LRLEYDTSSIFIFKSGTDWLGVLPVTADYLDACLRIGNPLPIGDLGRVGIHIGRFYALLWNIGLMGVEDLPVVGV